MRHLFLAPVILLAGCQAYVRSSAPVAPSAEMVRIVFRHPQVVVIARDDSAAGWADTLGNVSSVQGCILKLHGDTLQLAVTNFGRNGLHHPVGPGRHTAITMSTVKHVERRGFSPQQTVVRGTGVVMLAGLVAGLLHLIAKSLSQMPVS